MIHAHTRTRHTQTLEYYSAIKKKEPPAVCNNVDGGEGIMPSEISQTEKDKSRAISLMFVESTNVQQQQSKLLEKEIRSVVIRDREWGRGEKAQTCGYKTSTRDIPPGAHNQPSWEDRLGPLGSLEHGCPRLCPR